MSKTHKKQPIKFSCEGNSTEIHNSFRFFCVFSFRSRRKLMLTNPLFSAFIPNFHELLLARTKFLSFSFFALVMIKFYGWFSCFCCGAVTRNVLSIPPQISSFFPHFLISSLYSSSAVTKSTWLLTYRLVVKLFMNNNWRVCVCVCLSIVKLRPNTNELLSSKFWAVIWFFVQSTETLWMYDLLIKSTKTHKNQNRSLLSLGIVWQHLYTGHISNVCLINSLKCHSKVRNERKCIANSPISRDTHNTNDVFL